MGATATYYFGGLTAGVQYEVLATWTASGNNTE